MRGTVTVAIRNDDTGHTEYMVLGPDDYVVLHGPGLDTLDEWVTPLVGLINIRLKPRRD